MELFEVTMTYENVMANEEWERRFDAHLLKHEDTRNPLDVPVFSEPRPRRFNRTVYVQTFQGMPHEMIGRAAEIAIARTVGVPREGADVSNWHAHYAPVVENVKYIGSVFAEEPMDKAMNNE